MVAAGPNSKMAGVHVAGPARRAARGDFRRLAGAGCLARLRIAQLYAAELAEPCAPPRAAEG